MLSGGRFFINANVPCEVHMDHVPQSSCQYLGHTAQSTQTI